MIVKRKYILPIALVKIAFVYLILQLFFSSCSDDSLMYDSSIYTDGPLVEIAATFGNSFNAYNAQDTIYLDISIDSSVFYDEVHMTDVILNNALYTAKFTFINSNDSVVFPTMILEKGQVEKVSDSYYFAQFGYTDQESTLYKASQVYSKAYLRVGFVFDKPDSYVLYFHNTPNNLNASGEVDIYYNIQDDEYDGAYAIYLFDTNASKTPNYNDDIPYFEESKSADLLMYAAFDQAINEFTIIEE